MKKTMTTYDIAHELTDDKNANWSRAGAFALAEYLEECEEETGEEMELDIVAVRCDFSEYDSLLAFAEGYFADYKQAADALDLNIAMSGDEFEEDQDHIEDAITEFINQQGGQVIEFDGGVIVSSF